MSIYKSEHTDQPDALLRLWWRVMDIFTFRRCGSRVTIVYRELPLRCDLPRWHPARHVCGKVSWGYGYDLGEWWGEAR